MTYPKARYVPPTISSPRIIERLIPSLGSCKMNGSMTYVWVSARSYACHMMRLTKYPTAGANIVSVKDAIPIIIPVSSDEAPLSWACRLAIICVYISNTIHMVHVMEIVFLIKFLHKEKHRQSQERWIPNMFCIHNSLVSNLLLYNLHKRLDIILYS